MLHLKKTIPQVQNHQRKKKKSEGRETDLEGGTALDE